MKKNAYKLTKAQEEIVNFQGNEILIRGIAGSGKTLVLLQKAKQTAEKYPGDSVAIFTYNATLKNSAEQLMKEFGLNNLKVYTFHSWAMSSYFKTMRKKFILEQNTGKIMRDALSLSGKEHRFFQEEKYIRFLEDEISWIKGKGIFTREEYLSSQRTGRGNAVRLSQQDRETVYSFFEKYEELKAGKTEFDDFAPVLYLNREKMPESAKIDHIFIDEAQDLQQIQLQILKYAARKSFIVAADKSQKIYKTSFTWKDIGLNILGGRTRILRESFRSTKQIVSLASGLHNASQKEDEEYVETLIPLTEGPVPVLNRCSDKITQDTVLLNTLKQSLAGAPTATIGVLFREWNTSNRLKMLLDKESVPYEEIKRDTGSSHTPGIKLTTFHSAKGLEFDFVFAVDLTETEKADENMDEELFWETERKLFYVTLTRAKHYLQMYTYGNPLQLLDELDRSLYLEKKY